MEFNLGASKSVVIVSNGCEGAGAEVDMGVGTILGSAEDDYLGLAVVLQGAMDASVLKRIKGAQASLRSLIDAKVLIKSMDAKKATQMKTIFLQSR